MSETQAQSGYVTQQDLEAARCRCNEPGGLADRLISEMRAMGARISAEMRTGFDHIDDRFDQLEVRVYRLEHPTAPHTPRRGGGGR